MYPCRTDFSTDWSARKFAARDAPNREHKGEEPDQGKALRGQEPSWRSDTRRRVGTGERVENSLRGWETSRGSACGRVPE